jgi:hypothetical protein
VLSLHCVREDISNRIKRYGSDRPPTLSRNAKKAKKQYIKMGEALATTPEMASIWEDVMTARRECRLPSMDQPYFFFVSAPSGAGKTQLAYTLSTRVPVVHLLLTLEDKDKEEKEGDDDDYDAQDVYQSLTERSRLLIDALDSDTKRYGASPSVQYFRHECIRTLLTVQFLFQCFNEYRELSSCTVQSLRDFLFREGMKIDYVPVFILDEVQNTRKGILRMCYLRNLLRSVGVVVMALSTDAKVCETDANREYSRFSWRWRFSRVDDVQQSDEIWCKLITRLPRPTKQSLKLLGVNKALKTLCLSSSSSSTKTLSDSHYCSLRQFLSAQCHSSSTLPGIIKLLVRAVHEVDCSHDCSSSTGDVSSSSLSSSAGVLDRLIHHMSSSLFRCMPSLRSDDGLRGQVMIHLWGNTRGISNNNYFVASHFARLVDVNCSLFVDNRSESLMKEGGGQRWL